jgi:hypothetical protein
MKYEYLHCSSSNSHKINNSGSFKRISPGSAHQVLQLTGRTTEHTVAHLMLPAGDVTGAIQLHGADNHSASQDIPHFF